MKSNELRIGNYVNWNGQQIELDRVSFQVHVINRNCEDIVPIPLTEDWLVKLGFEKEHFEENYWYELKLPIHSFNLLSNDIGSDAFYDKLEFVFLEDCDEIQYRYVQQLQNLYHALTGEELTYTP